MSISYVRIEFSYYCKSILSDDSFYEFFYLIQQRNVILENGVCLVKGIKGFTFSLRSVTNLSPRSTGERTDIFLQVRKLFKN